MSNRRLPTEAEEWDLLASALNRYGVKHIAPHVRVKSNVPTGEELFRRLALARSVRLREAMILLLLTHPDLDTAARSAIGQLSGDAQRRAMYRYVVAAALQQMWWTRLSQDLGPRRAIEPAYLAELGLPCLEDDFGRRTLLAVSNLEGELYGHNAWAGYNSLMDLFLAELIDASWGQIDARAG